MQDLKLWMVVLGGKPLGRNIEQHDVMFAIAKTIEAAYPAMKKYWPIVGLHMDAYIQVKEVDGYEIHIVDNQQLPKQVAHTQLYFVNLGGYLANDPEEYHKKIILAASSETEAKQRVQEDIFYRQGLQDKHARPHVDDQVLLNALSVDDCFKVGDQIDGRYHLVLQENVRAKYAHNSIHIGYRPLPF